VVGNDVVDLADPSIAHHHLNARFVARVCAPEERGLARSKAGLWTIFAAKEAAYKALVKLGRSPGFAHRAIVVASDLASVRWQGIVLRLSVACDDESVHAVAWSADPAPLARLARAREPLERAARDLLCELTAAMTGCDASAIAVVRDPEPNAWDGFGPPRVERGGKPLALDVSLSHDGRFVAVAARLTSS
jgi:phosphopantetheinyl transferase (holo-ACP synthase)